ncbi:MAG: alanine--tRNA ligase-related protein, partial [Chthoniobacteraceae bacterium]
FAIADGIQPGNTDRNYVLRRILRRAVRYGRTLGFTEPFFYKLVPVLIQEMAEVFPELRTKQKHIEEVLRREEEQFNKTLDKGIEMFEEITAYRELVESLFSVSKSPFADDGDLARWLRDLPAGIEAREDSPIRVEEWKFMVQLRRLGVEMSEGSDSQRESAHARQTLVSIADSAAKIGSDANTIPGASAFKLYDTYGFPLDLTELMARERGLTVDTAGFEIEMEKQRARARASQKKTVIELSEVETKEPTVFLGYEMEDTVSDVLEVVTVKGKTAVIVAATPCYAEMGGQVGDTGTLSSGGREYPITNTIKVGGTWVHYIETGGDESLPVVGAGAHVLIDQRRRDAIQRHHTVTHLLHWALHEVVSREATQKGSFVGPDKLTFDFNHQALTPPQVRDVERLVNKKIIENTPVSWIEVPFADVRGRADIMQFFGDKYGETVRVVQIGGAPTALDGYSMELCAGTHTRRTGEIGLFRINSEAAIAAGVRRIEAVAGLNAYDAATADMQRLHTLAATAGTPLADLERRIEGLLSHQKELENALKSAQQREAAGRAKDLLSKVETINGTPAIIANLGDVDAETLQTVADSLKSHGFHGVTVLGGAGQESVALLASVSPEFAAKVPAGKLIQQIAPIVGGKGGGKPEAARGGGKDPAKLDEALARARSLL